MESADPSLRPCHPDLIFTFMHIELAWNYSMFHERIDLDPIPIVAPMARTA
jgi:hypothetical protein